MNLLIGFEHFTIDIFLHAASSGSFSKFYMATTTTEEILIYDKTQIFVPSKVQHNGLFENEKRLEWNNVLFV